ncbi:hypothetical protein LIER_23818 [Lithospermum erythrorhizon]|uniref:Uncharacterized protein n=1 Tax=Lithospermum erythrorhizon TaxID=34254 RepID=A0AAV3QZ39_LITER
MGSPPPLRIKREPQEVPRLIGHIDTISGGIEGGGDSRNSRKNYTRREGASMPSLNKGLGERERKRSRKSHMEINKVKSEEDNSPKEMKNENRVVPKEEVLIVPFMPERITSCNWLSNDSWLGIQPQPMETPNGRSNFHWRGLPYHFNWHSSLLP